jgi:hypothetical protein
VKDEIEKMKVIEVGGTVVIGNMEKIEMERYSDKIQTLPQRYIK